jgi:HEXXH motif-containing protein
MFGDDDRHTYFAPWRPDPRPLSGALHGAYAFTAVAAFWHSLRVEPTLERQATMRFAILRAEVNRVLPELSEAPGLTAAGQRFVALLVGRAGWLARQDVPRSIESLAVRRLSQLERRWRRRNGLVR